MFGLFVATKATFHHPLTMLLFTRVKQPQVHKIKLSSANGCELAMTGIKPKQIRHTSSILYHVAIVVARPMCNIGRPYPSELGRAKCCRRASKETTFQI